MNELRFSRNAGLQGSFIYTKCSTFTTLCQGDVSAFNNTLGKLH